MFVYIKNKKMKNLVKISLLACTLLSTTLNLFAQRAAVIAIDGMGTGLSNDEITQLTRLELQKFDNIIVIDRFDVEQILKNNQIDPATCFNTECLVKAGELLKVDWVLTGSVNNVNNFTVANFKIIDIKQGLTTNAIVREFKQMPNQTQNQVQITLSQLLKKPYNTELYELIKRDPKQEQMLVQADVKQLNLSGPRMGLTYLFGEAGKILKAPLKDGGFDMNPLMFQIGYQFEKQYLNSGKMQALFEIVPLVTGIDQNTFVPSLSIVNGLRNNKNGFEFGIGAVFSFIKEAEMFTHTDNKDYLVSKWREVPKPPESAPNDRFFRMHSDGDPRFMTAIVIAVGKSFKSGNLNIPVNLYCMPMRDGVRVGLIGGFNTKK
jgi:TolB-like protein